MADSKTKAPRRGVNSERLMLAAIVLGPLFARPGSETKEGDHLIDIALDAADRLVARAQERDDAQDAADEAAAAAAAKGGAGGSSTETGAGTGAGTGTDAGAGAGSGSGAGAPAP